MSKIFRQLQVEPVNFTAGTLKTRELPATVYRGLNFRLVINHDNAAAITIDAYQFLKAMIEKLSVVINGQDTLISIPAHALALLNRYDFSRDVYADIKTATGTNLTSTISFYLPFALTRAVRPEDTLLDARRPKVNTLVLETQWANPSIANVTINSAVLNIETCEYANVAENAQFGRHEFGFDIVQLDSVGLIQHKLEVGGLNQYRRLLFISEQGGAFADVIDSVAVRSRSFYFYNRKAVDVKALNQLNYAIAPYTGVLITDFTTDGKMSQRLDARNLSELIAEITSNVSDGQLLLIKEKAIFA